MVEEKSVTEGIGGGYQKDPRWAKKSTLISLTFHVNRLLDIRFT